MSANVEELQAKMKQMENLLKDQWDVLDYEHEQDKGNGVCSEELDEGTCSVCQWLRDVTELLGYKG